MEGATIDEVISRLEQIKMAASNTEDDMDEKGIRALLNIKDDADILEAVTALKGKSEALPATLSASEQLRSRFGLGKDASDADLLAKMQEPAPTEFSEEVKQGFAERDAKIAVLQRDNDVRRFSAQTTNFSMVQGTPEELAIRLVDIKDKMGDEAVTLQITDWERQQELGVAAGVTVRFGSHAEGSPGDWDAALTKWKEDHPREKGQRQVQWDADAIKAIQEEQPALYREYYEAHRVAIKSE